MRKSHPSHSDAPRPALPDRFRGMTRDELKSVALSLLTEYKPLFREVFNITVGRDEQGRVHVHYDEK